MARGAFEKKSFFLLYDVKIKVPLVRALRDPAMALETAIAWCSKRRPSPSPLRTQV